MDQSTSYFLRQIKCRRPDAVALIKGSFEYPGINGLVTLCQTSKGVIVTSEIWGLPDQGNHPCMNPIFAMHIHSGESCTGNSTEPFSGAGDHFNPNSCKHPHHAGDLPNLFSNKGLAWSSVLTDRFNVRSVIGKTIIIHSQPDDFRTQPSGNAGRRIACGIIKKMD